MYMVYSQPVHNVESGVIVISFLQSKIFHLPASHVFPVQLEEHVQLKSPAVLVHRPPFWHGDSIAHSSMSKKMQKKDKPFPTLDMQACCMPVVNREELFHFTFLFKYIMQIFSFHDHPTHFSSSDKRINFCCKNKFLIVKHMLLL